MDQICIDHHHLCNPILSPPGAEGRVRRIGSSILVHRQGTHQRRLYAKDRSLPPRVPDGGRLPALDGRKGDFPGYSFASVFFLPSRRKSFLLRTVITTAAPNHTHPFNAIARKSASASVSKKNPAFTAK
jgi:hypothetical protein